MDRTFARNPRFPLASLLYTSFLRRYRSPRLNQERRNGTCRQKNIGVQDLMAGGKLAQTQTRNLEAASLKLAPGNVKRHTAKWSLGRAGIANANGPANRPGAVNQNAPPQLAENHLPLGSVPLNLIYIYTCIYTYIYIYIFFANT